jgi:hypothetical protein
MTKRFTNAFLEKFPQYVPPGLEEAYAPKPEVFEAVKKAVAARRAPTEVDPGAAMEDPAMTAPAPVAPADDDLEARLAERKQELLDAQGMRDDRTFGANLFEAAGQMAQGASGAEGAYDGSFYGKLRDQATQGVTDVGAKQKLLADEQGAVAKERETKRTAALGDARSTQSMVARNVARRRIQESGGDPSMISDGMSALDVADLDKQVSGLETNATRKQTAADALASRELMARLAAQSKREAAATRADQAKGPQFQAAGFGKRVENAAHSMDDLANSGYDRSSAGSAFRSALPNFAMSDEGQVQEQAERDFINAVLRRESGAAISKSEFESGEKQYFPRQGDSEEVKQKKRNNRMQVLNSLQAEAGPAWNKIASAGTPSGGTAPASEVKRKTKDGRVAIFDAGTKKFLRYEGK